MPTLLKDASIHELQRELSVKKRKVGGLVKKRDRLMGKVQELDAKIREHGPMARHAHHGGRRFKNAKPLAESLADVLMGKTMSVTDVAEAVKQAGYQTTANGNFRTIVNQTLIGRKKMFRRVERGMYTAKARKPRQTTT